MNHNWNFLWITPFLIGIMFVIVTAIQRISEVQYLVNINVSEYIFQVVLCMLVAEYGMKGLFWGLKEFQDVTESLKKGAKK